MGDDITLYWLTATATSAARLYWESWDKDWGMMKVDIPVGYSIFPGEIFRAPQDLLSHQRFSSRMALPCLKPATIKLDSARARSTAVSLDRFANSQHLDDREYRDVNESLLIESACARR